MGCGSSSAAAQQPQVQGPTLLTGSNDSNDKPIVPGQSAIIRNCPNAKLNGKQVVCEEYNTALGEWNVKGEGFPLSIGMSMPTQYLEVVVSGSNDKKIVPGTSAIIRNCPNAKLNGKQVVCEEYNTALGEWNVKGEGFPLCVGMSMPTQYLEVVVNGSNDKQIVPGQSAIIRNCPNAKLNGKQVVCEEYNTDLGEWQ